jgi:hypothetical protein
VKAARLFQRRFTLTCKDGRVLSVFMDLYRLPDGSFGTFPEGYRFSWIAYASDDEELRVLFDCHPPKGPHFHVDGELRGQPFHWTTLDAAYELFFAKVREHFGDFREGS